MTALVPAPSRDLARLAALAERTEEYAQASLADSTRRLYDHCWNDWLAWCEETTAVALPADPRAVAMFLTERAGQGLSISSLRKRIAAIGHEHEAAGVENLPTKAKRVRDTMRGISREVGPLRPVQNAKPALMDDVAAMLAHLPEGDRGVRDRAVLLVGFAGCRRRSEIAGLNLSDVEDGSDGLRVRLRKTKTDQAGELRQVVGVPYSPNPDTCPVRAWRAWLQVLIDADALDVADEHGLSAFREIRYPGDRLTHNRMSDRAIARMVRRYALAAGLPAGRWSGHSLRAGFITQAAKDGVQERIIAKQSLHVSMTVLRTYIREGDLFRENAAAAVLR